MVVEKIIIKYLLLNALRDDGFHLQKKPDGIIQKVHAYTSYFEIIFPVDNFFFRTG